MWFPILSVALLAAVVSGIPCEEARIKCAYREGCGTALRNYIVGCSGVLQGPEPTYCPEVCEHSLIALVSTEEGDALMKCECSDSYCEDQKQRSEICRPGVTKTINEPIIPCRIAQWICDADAQCSMAFEFYQRNCKAMFHGKKCTPRCHNSINILRRQDKAQKLKMCKCDGSEDYNCRAIQRNMDKLCFHNTHHRFNLTRTEVPIDDRPKVIVTSASSGERSEVSLLIFLSILLVFGG